MAGYRDLTAWQKEMTLAESIYRVTKQFPASEQFGLTSQLRRAGVSVPSNIALGSVREVETQIILAGRLQFADREALGELLRAAEEVARLINGLLRCDLPERQLPTRDS